MEYINISHRRDLKCKIHNVSSENLEVNSVFNILKEEGFWCSRKSEENIGEYIIIDYQKVVTINYLEITPSQNGPSTFPKDFRFEGSLDGNTWKIIHYEKNLVLEANTYRLNIPLSQLQYIKLIIIEHNAKDERYFSEIGRYRAGISGIKEIKASSISDENSSPVNLLSTDPEKYWQSKIKQNISKETLIIDFGNIFHINRIILGSGSVGFPNNFYLETSPDNKIWTPLLDEKNFKAQVNKNYFWTLILRPQDTSALNQRE